MSIGYGTSMSDADEFIWAAGADAASSAEFDTWSDATGLPTLDTHQTLYTTSTPVVNGDFIEFTSTRPLTPAAQYTHSATITLDTATDMIWAWGTYTSTETYTGGAIAYHTEGTATGDRSVPGWTMTVSDSGVTSTGNNGITADSLTKILELSNGSTLEAGY